MTIYFGIERVGERRGGKNFQCKCENGSEKNRPPGRRPRGRLGRRKRCRPEPRPPPLSLAVGGAARRKPARAQGWPQRGTSLLLRPHLSPSPLVLSSSPSARRQVLVRAFRAQGEAWAGRGCRLEVVSESVKLGTTRVGEAAWGWQRRAHARAAALVPRSGHGGGFSFGAVGTLPCAFAVCLPPAVGPSLSFGSPSAAPDCVHI